MTDNGTPALSHTNAFAVTVNVATAVWSAIPGTSYHLQYKTNLADGSWDDLPGEVTASGTSASIEDSSPDPTRFYRLIVLP